MSIIGGATLIESRTGRKVNNALTGTTMGTLALFRTSIDVVGELVDQFVWGEDPSSSLKLPTLGTRLQLSRPVEPILGDLLLAACVDLALGPRAFLA